MENFCDTYHVFKVHEQLDQAYVSEVRSTARPDGVHMFMFNTLAGDSRGLSLDSDGPTLPSIPGLPEALTRAQPSCNLFPNVTIVVDPGNLQFVMFEPVGPDRCIMHLWYYFVGRRGRGSRPPASPRAGLRRLDPHQPRGRRVCQRLQEGRSCDAYDGGRLAPYWDVGTAHFHRHIADAILGQGSFARA